MGSFSNTERALPVESSEVRTAVERVTFKIVPLAQLKYPGRWVTYLRSIRPELLVLSLGPAVLTWFNHRGSPPAWERWSAWAALAGVFFLHVATFVYNDVLDHVRGVDRVNRRRGSRVIQRGWVTAAAMKNWARLNFALAIACGLPTFYRAPVELTLITLGMGVAFLILSRNVLTRRGLADLATAALGGPLLTGGVAYASFGEADYTDLALGISLGLSTTLVWQTRQFQNMFRAEPKTFRTALGHLSFDGARAALVVENLSLALFTPVAAVILRLPLVFLMIWPLCSWPLFRRARVIWRARSPLASDLVHSARAALIAHSVLVGWWLLALGASWA